MDTSHGKIQALTPGFVDQAYTLAREANARLTLEDWRRFAGPRTAGQPTDLQSPGIMVVVRNELIRGLATFSCQPDQSGTRLLNAEDIIIMDRARKERVSQELLGGLLEVALRDNCARLRAALPRSSVWLDKLWSDPDGSLFRLPIECIRMDNSSATLTPDGNVVSLHVPAA